ncbi:MAG: hypothetical protein IPI21_17915 [Propionivibrio sp.]|nr:hypothetical protein [Propionivibrio sp.]
MHLNIQLLRYGVTLGVIEPPAAIRSASFAAVIANPVHWQLASLPRALNVEDADRLLMPGRSTRDAQAREHGDCALGTGFGLRCGEIAHLNLNDIDPASWHTPMLQKGTKSLRQDAFHFP